MIDGFYTAEEIKPLLGLKSQRGDCRTLNKYVRKGKLEMRALSPRILHQLFKNALQLRHPQKHLYL